MDLNPPENLDPKLKEAYERVMANKPHMPIVNNDDNEASQVSKPQTIPSSESSAHETYEKTTQENINSYDSKHPKKGHNIIFIILFIGGIIFLLAYGVIWAKIFNLI